MNQRRTAVFVIALILCLSFSALGDSIQATDYANSQHWLSLPTSVDKKVDVFYLYPTVYQKADASQPDICDIDNPSMLKYAKLAFGLSGTVFETIGNIYAPYYRQADAATVLSLPLDEQGKLIGGIPKADAFAAFDYYIKNYNHGRPFILASHSQGSNVMIYLLSEYMKKHPDVYRRMIAAYVVGYSVTGDYLSKNPHLKFAKGPDDTGVIISYNTEAPQVAGNNPVVLPGAIAINPITWTREETLAPSEKNLGTIDMDMQGNITIPGYTADARVDKAKGVVICSSTNVDVLSPGNKVFPKGVYHHYDYPFYYYNIRQNAANRANIFLKHTDNKISQANCLSKSSK